MNGPGEALRSVNAPREALRSVLADHFVMWHELEGFGPPGEWRCACGKKFGFSDSAIDHQAETLLASGVVRVLFEGVTE